MKYYIFIAYSKEEGGNVSPKCENSYLFCVIMFSHRITGVFSVYFQRERENMNAAVAHTHIHAHIIEVWCINYAQC